MFAKMRSYVTFMQIKCLILLYVFYNSAVILPLK